MNQVYKLLGSSNRRGFTLMEIMVVIIVIAVLASVAGPMIGSITDQGKASATKATLQTMKTAFVNYANDLGRFCHNRNNLNASNFNEAWADLSPLRTGNPVLRCPFTEISLPMAAAAAWNNLGMAATTYSRRWKGPYFDGNPEAYFVDAWGNNIDVFYHTKGLWARSPGSNSGSDGAAAVIVPVYGANEGEDDVVMSLGKVRF